VDKFLEVSNHNQFLTEMAKHKMVVKQDEGLYKHLVFAEPGNFELAFEIVSFPHHVMITGDMGCYCFSREPDMFKWFIKDGVKSIASPEIEVNRWRNKLVSIDSSMGVVRKSTALAIKMIEENRAFYLKEYPEHADEINEKFDNLLGYEESGIDILIYEMCYLSLCLGHEDEHSPFSDLEIEVLETYTPQFVWCCYALNYGIGEYFQSKQ